MLPTVFAMPLEILGLATIITLGFAGALGVAKAAIAKVSEAVKDGMAAKHVVQAIAEFKANHPEIAKLYDEVTK